jgi:hypothetical protein
MSKHQRPLTQLLCALACVWLGAACASVSAQGVPSLADQPEAVRRAVLLGEPRSSTHIAASPFGIMTVLCFENAASDFSSRVAGVIAAAGYKWVGEYLQLTWAPNAAPKLEEAERWSRVPTRCTEHLARLQASNIEVLMRVDPLPTRLLRGPERASDADLAVGTAYLRSVVAQLKPYVKHWQIGNEPNIANAPEAYVRVLEVMARAIRAEQPDAVIYGPAAGMLQCMADEPYPWLPKALRAGLMKHIDVFSFHPYRGNGDEPERASEFARWRHWPTYGNQLDALRLMLRAAGAKSVKLAVSEDGEASAISADGQQRITPIIDAKNELRRSLLDFAEGIAPRIHFVFFRSLPDAVFNNEGSFNVVDSALNKKPLYFAAQNLHAVLDSSYQKTEKPQPRLHTKGPAAPKAHVQTYLKHHDGFDELAIYFWAPVPAQNMHLREPLSIELGEADWQAPVLIDLMTMPGRARPAGHQPSTHQRTTYPNARKTQGGVQIEGLELRDYPQVLKLIRLAR